MKTMTIFSVVLLCSAATVLGEDPFKVSLYYETYCPYCVKFVNEQLVKIIKLLDLLELQLVPYGNAGQILVDGHYEFNCQHGPHECLANKLHACAIYQACGDAGTVSCSAGKVTQVIEYISCVMQQADQLEATAQCSRDSKLDADNIISCAKGDQGNNLMSLYGNLTEEVSIGGVPTVIINGKKDDAALSNLMERLCQLNSSLCIKTDDVL